MWKAISNKMKEKGKKNMFYTKDFVYLVDFFVNIGFLVLVFFKSYKISGTIMGGILTSSGIIIIFGIIIDVLVIFCQLLYLFGRLRNKMPNDMDIVSRWPNIWIFGKILILACFIVAYFLEMNLVAFLFSV